MDVVTGGKKCLVNINKLILQQKYISKHAQISSYSLALKLYVTLLDATYGRKMGNVPSFDSKIYNILDLYGALLH
jgi:hypothetical protein